MNRIFPGLAASSAVLALLSAPLYADVSIQEKVSNNGFRGMGAFESSATREISGVKSREESTMRFTGKVLKFMTGGKGKKTVQIVRVDLDKRWGLDPDKKTYTESPIAVELKEGEEKQEKGEPEEKKPTHRVKKVDFSVKKTDEKKTVNGFETRKYVGTLTVEVENLETKETAASRLVSEMRVTPWTQELRRAVKEQKEFAEAYLKKVGEKLTPAEKRALGQDTVAMMLGVGGPEAQKTLSKFKGEVDSIDGYPIVTESNWYLPKPEGEAAHEKKSRTAEPDEDESLDVSGGAAGIAKGFLGGLAKKKMKEKMEERAKEQEGKPEISTRTEIEAIGVKAIPKEDFELPEGYKKKG